MQSIEIQTTGPLLFNVSTQTTDLVSASNYETAHQDFLSEVVGKEYRMAHHNNNHWAIICEKLQPIAEGKATLQEIIETIGFFVNDQQFQSRYMQLTIKKLMTFMLDEFFNRLEQQERTFFEKELFPSIAKLILETETLFPLDRKFSILTKKKNKAITFSKLQCACLIAHMVFCITVDQAVDFKLPELIDFSVIFSKPGMPRNMPRKIPKLKCIFTYFESIFYEEEKRNGNVIFERIYLPENPNDEIWMRCRKSMTNAQILSQGGIEDSRDTLKVVFSDKELGDQVLQLPATQQQIMSLIHPEIMLSILFCEELESEEVIRVFGAGRFSNYTGYGDTFEFAGRYEGNEDPTERHHVIMDAEKYNLKQTASQFDGFWVLRELNKAYSGFIESDYEEVPKTTMEIEEETGRKVATGKWGCGVFKGNPQLKFIIQWLAASRANRDIVFYSYGDTVNFNAEDVEKILNYYTGQEVRELYEDLVYAAREMQSGKMRGKTTQEDSVLPEVTDENKNLFKVLVTRKGL